MKVKFYSYCGLAGDNHKLLVCIAPNGLKVSRLYNRAWFKNWNLARAKKKLVSEMEIMTGRQVTQ